MQSAVLRALEFDCIVEMVRGFALTPMGDERLAGSSPRRATRRRGAMAAATTETTKYLAANNLFPLRAPAEFRRRLPRSPSKAARSNRCGC